MAKKEHELSKRLASMEESSNSLLSILKGLRKHWPLVAAGIIIGAAASLLYTKSLPKVYDSGALIEFDPNVIRPLADKEEFNVRSFSSYWDNREYYETQYRVMTSERVMSAVVRELGLQSDPEFLGYRPTSPIPLVDASALLRSRVFVDPVKASRLVTIRVEDMNPKLAQRLCEAVVRTYITQNLEKTVAATGDAVAWLGGQLNHFQSELEQNENSIHEFKKTNDLPSSTFEEISKMIRLEMEQYDHALTQTRTRKQELLARSAELAKVKPEQPDEIPASELLGNAFLSQLRSAYQVAFRERRELMAAGKGEQHPEVKRYAERAEQLQKDLFEEISNIRGAVDRDLAIINREEAGEAGLLEGARRKAVDLNLKELEFHRLDRTRAQNEKLYGALLDQMKSADLARMMNVNNIRLVDAATEPKFPSRPKVGMNVAIGALIGLVLGVVLAIVREQLDNSLKSPHDLEHNLGVTYLGLLPEVDDENAPQKKSRKRREKSRRRLPASAAESPPELIVHDRPLSGIAEAARTLRTNLMFMNPDHPHRRLLVTSAAPAEGKTTVACSVAISLAQGGQRVCIVDCDLRRPRLHHIFNRVGDAGLTNYLVGEATMDEVAQLTQVPNLWCVPAGPTPPNPADVLHSERFKRFLAELSERFDRVVIDSPPLVAVTDSAIISTLVDGTLFVVRAFSTSRALGRQGLRVLADVDAPVVGAVLNAVDLEKHGYNYFQYYYYYKRVGYRPLTTTNDPPSPSRAARDTQGGPQGPAGPSAPPN